MVTLQEIIDIDASSTQGVMAVSFNTQDIEQGLEGVDLNLDRLSATATTTGSLTLGAEPTFDSLGNGLTVSNGALVAPGDGGAATLGELGDVTEGTLANRPVADGTQGWYFTNDGNGVYFDSGSWTLIAENPSNILAADLGFDPATQSELNVHTGTTDAHHAQGLIDGQNFDGLGTSQFSNLSSVDTGYVQHTPQDVRNISTPVQGVVAYHDPSVSGDTNTEGPAFYNGTAWTSLVDGTTIS